MSNLLDINATILQLLKKCLPLLSASDTRRDTKIATLDGLYLLWTNNKQEIDYSATVYELVINVFVNNVFSSSNSVTKKDKKETLYEFENTELVYQMFQAFLKHNGFRPRKAQPFLDKDFVDSTIQRLNSTVTAERIAVRDTIRYLHDTCSFLRSYIFQSAICVLESFAYGKIRYHNGISEMLDVLKYSVIYSSIAETALNELSKIIIHLISHKSLVLFNIKLVECVAAIDKSGKTLIPEILITVLRLWRENKELSLVYMQLVEKLYTLCDKGEWMVLQPRLLSLITDVMLGKENTALSNQAIMLWNQIFPNRNLPDN
ncbi:serine/threonine-protein phosphatase 2A regulatory subunit pptr-1-like [Daktulosphaira vitifoliae]|uniref:serine/threonine-protein phosphatase 2A regulatory subunit pptr-1-like n=1 Tax=Daktulosphaira vitifoliae TaxID=58002 RepID=UPI0021AAAB7D|nr:serine/threonine-protein phosphatase 2A regulatory subunit pptr-1-like [Daktulosphaira vitifoliae]